MSIRPIITYNDPILSRKCEPVGEQSEELQELIDDMFDTMYHARGVGLAAPQVGELLQLFVIDADAMTEDAGEPSLGPMVFINPQVEPVGEEVLVLEEGCLSIPTVRDEVTRPERVRVRWLDRTFQEREQEFSGWAGRVIQHEYDHLQGILFLNYLTPFRRRIHRPLLEKIETGRLETDYPLAEK